MTNAEIAEICQSAALELRELIEAVNKSTPLDEGFHDFQTCSDLMNVVRHLTAAPAQAEPSDDARDAARFRFVQSNVETLQWCGAGYAYRFYVPMGRDDEMETAIDGAIANRS